MARARAAASPTAATDWDATLADAAARIEQAARTSGGRAAIASLCRDTLALLVGQPLGEVDYLAGQLMLWFRDLPPARARSLCAAAMARAACHGRLTARPVRPARRGLIAATGWSAPHSPTTAARP